MSAWKAKRFWKQASVAEAEAGYTITLDGRPVHTPMKTVLVVPTRALALAIAEEWEAQEDAINPETMPLTRAANSAQEKVAPHLDAVRDMLAEYGDTDLICYRAEGPEALIARQSEAWDPLLAWAAEAYGARLIPVTGVMYHAQLPEARAKLRAALDGMDPFRLTGVHDLITISGSLILGLAVADRHLRAADAWSLARIDEAWQEEQWGEDSEAQDAATRKRADFLRAERLLDLLEG
ncbi:chaperone required for assembly of F1-ATPase [Rubricella aquisinus]|uniref:Chaperone required for assembly of F1-ATPase n=1 Tax=Rubricella aquisinus TaxID=2028108 RepID=A0A840X2L3_9RHOB|nr:ATP12 family protein [Rubricella aquisinus]MBB5517074.1 chaperone required for assembly of F1-ATPase [Rubricella aquisinus]